MKKTALAKIVILAIVLALIFFFSTNLKKSLPNHPDTASVTADSNINRTVFQKFIVDGGPIVWFVLIPLSLLTLYLVTEYAMIIRRRHLLPEKIACSLTKIIKNHQDQAEFINQIRKKDDLVSISIEYALTSGKNDFFRIKSLASESLQDQAMALFRKIQWLALIGNIAPMVGLFGTVFGMIKLFDSIVTTAGQPQPADFAGGISIALVTTFWGLFIAIPALAFHGIFRNSIESIVSDAVSESENVIDQIRYLYVKKTNVNDKNLLKNA